MAIRGYLQEGGKIKLRTSGSGSLPAPAKAKLGGCCCCCHARAEAAKKALAAPVPAAQDEARGGPNSAWLAYIQQTGLVGEVCRHHTHRSPAHIAGSAASLDKCAAPTTTTRR